MHLQLFTSTDSETLTQMSIFLWMQAKCDASAFWQRCKCLLTKMQMQFFKCKCLMQGWKCKVYSWWCQCTHSDHDANVSLQRWRCKCLLMGMSWCKYPFVGIPWCKCFDVNTIYSKIPFVFKSRLSQHLKPKYFQNLIYYSQKIIFFFI